MKNFFSIIVIFAVLLVGGGWVFLQQQEQEAQKKLLEDRASARRTFAAKARSAAGEGDEQAYVRAMKAAISSYDEELKKSVYGDHPDWRDPGSYKKTVEARFEAGEMKEAERKSRLEGFEIVQKAYDVLMEKSWQPVLTQKGNADTRLDLYRLERIKDSEGRPVLQLPFFFWGIEDSTYVSWGQLAIRIWTTEMGKVREGRRMVEKEVEKVLGRSEGEAQPHVIIQTPANYIADFPSFVSIGYLWLPPLPREAKMIDITYSYATRQTGGGEVMSELKWEKIPVPSSWMLDAGDDWEAEVIEATEDEIAGRDPENEEEEEEK